MTCCEAAGRGPRAAAWGVRHCLIVASPASDAITAAAAGAWRRSIRRVSIIEPSIPFLELDRKFESLLTFRGEIDVGAIGWQTHWKQIRGQRPTGAAARARSIAA